MKKRENILFARIGWMNRYEGDAPDDPLMFAGEPLTIDQYTGHEARMFTNSNDWCYAGIWPQFNGNTGEIRHIRLEQLGAGKRDLYIDDVTVVFLAHEKHGQILRLVGYYEHARAYRSLQVLPWEKFEYNIVCRSRDAHRFDVRPDIRGLKWFTGTHRYYKNNKTAPYRSILKQCGI